VACYEAVTVGHSFVEVHDGYSLTPVAPAARASAAVSRDGAARST
jgi:hypothetical protein